MTAALRHGSLEGQRWAAQWSRDSANRNRFKKQDIGERLMRWCEPDPNSGCWLWFGGQQRRGYGAIGISGKMHGAHRVSAQHFLGVSVEGKAVLHKCDTPECINPDHLTVGTLKDNMVDMVRKGRNKTRRGTASGQSSLTEADVRAIRASDMKQIDLARAYGVSAGCIRDIQSGKNWKHV